MAGISGRQAPGPPSADLTGIISSIPSGGRDTDRPHPGKRSPFVHRHEDAEEIYVILGGSGRVKLDDQIADVRRLDTIRVAPEVARAFEAGPEGLEFLAFGPHHPGDGEPVDDPWADEG